MGKKKIVINLSEQSIDNALKELRAYKREIAVKTDILRKRIADLMQEEIKKGFDGAIVDDMVSSRPRTAKVDVSLKENGNVTVIVAQGEDAVWVEFGAGIYHNGSSGSSPHPYGAELGMIIGEYGKGQGKKKAWGYYEDGELKITRGTPAKMPMYNAVANIRNDLLQIVKEVFG